MSINNISKFYPTDDVYAVNATQCLCRQCGDPITEVTFDINSPTLFYCRRCDTNLPAIYVIYKNEPDTFILNELIKKADNVRRKI